MKDIKKELIFALKYICPKFGYGFLGLGLALMLTQPGKMADILFSASGIGLLGFTMGGILFYVIGGPLTLAAGAALCRKKRKEKGSFES